MIRSLADDTTRDIWNGVNSKAARRIPRAIWPVIQRKLDQIDSVAKLDDLRVPPLNVGEMLGEHAANVLALLPAVELRVENLFGPDNDKALLGNCKGLNVPCALVLVSADSRRTPPHEVNLADCPVSGEEDIPFETLR